ncbi:MAG TPA: hypothetical protein VFT10_08965 [Solirubrobacterales bacterium]|nr:hypothetical protein [Solirubrobacterales bacterium]
MSAMRRRLGMAVAGLALGLALLGASTASAAIEVGDECAANVAEGPYSIVPEKRASAGPLPLAAPVGGVVTAWKVNSAHTESVPERMAVFRPTGVAGQFQVVGESNEQNVNPGANVFPTRIPVQAGDRFGPVAVILDSPLYCVTGNAADGAWFFVGSAGVGSTHTYGAGVEVRAAMIAVIEADKDGDGYGDETQDRCPQSAAYQGECPTIALDAFPIVLKRSVLVLVTASSTSSVHVFGQVGWKAKRKGSARISKTKPGSGPATTGVIVGLAADTQTVNPGAVAKFNVKLPKSVKRQLGQMPPSKSLKAQLTASTTDLAGRVSIKVLTIRLPGQDRR